MSRILFATACLLCLVFQDGWAQSLNVEKMTFCTSVENRKPDGVGIAFPADVGRVYCFTKITGATEETKVIHVWHYKKEEIHRYELSVKASTWRTWSYKTIVEEWTGHWRVDILSASGSLLKSNVFVIQ